MGKLKDLKAKLFRMSSKDVKDIKKQSSQNENEIKVYYKDLEKQKKEILKQIELINEQIEQYREIGAKDTMNWLQGYKEILNDQLKEIDSAEVKLGEDKWIY